MPSSPNPAMGLLSTGAGLVRIATGAAWRATTWGVGTSVRATSRLVRAAASGEPLPQLMTEMAVEARQQAFQLLGVDPDRAAAVMGGLDRFVPGRVRNGDDEAAVRRLRQLGDDLLKRSVDVRYEEPVHPAYARILGELAPDEARILRLLAADGPQPSVDVRSGSGTASSQLVAPGLSMIGAHAGCRYPDRVPAYLNNLYRLGMVWFSREPIRDILRYQVLEAQPEVADALEGARRSKTVRRSIHLTPFGEDFCTTCLPISDG